MKELVLAFAEDSAVTTGLPSQTLRLAFVAALGTVGTRLADARMDISGGDLVGTSGRYQPSYNSRSGQFDPFDLAHASILSRLRARNDPRASQKNRDCPYSYRLSALCSSRSFAYFM